MTLLEHDRPKTFAYTNGEAAEIDELQYDEGDGPCLTAYRQQEVIRVESNRTEELAGVCRRAPQHGVLICLSLTVGRRWGRAPGPSTSPATPTAPPPTPLLRLIPFKAFPIRWQDSGSGVFTLAQHLASSDWLSAVRPLAASSPSVTAGVVAQTSSSLTSTFTDRKKGQRLSGVSTSPLLSAWA
ncbi:MAG TPA: hypothetical protein VK988_12085 [Acidimicrobiales bacterium]|nr:hypothetical protein [Acidimicrobiales bacterium]